MALDASEEVGGGRAGPGARDKEASGGRRFDQECRYPSGQGRPRGPESQLQAPQGGAPSLVCWPLSH